MIHYMLWILACENHILIKIGKLKTIKSNYSKITIYMCVIYSNELLIHYSFIPVTLICFNGSNKLPSPEKNFELNSIQQSLKQCK